MSTRARILTVTVGERLVTETCYSCGVLFAMAEDLRNHRLRDGKSFFCPSGHSQAYVQGKTDEQKLKEAEAREVALQDQLAAAVRDAEQSRARLLRDRHRIANGVCPCCNRTFDNVRRHMASKHPEYDAAKVAKPMRAKCSCGQNFDTPHGLAVHQGKARRRAGSYRWDRQDTPRHVAHLTEVGAR